MSQYNRRRIVCQPSFMDLASIIDISADDLCVEPASSPGATINVLVLSSSQLFATGIAATLERVPGCQVRHQERVSAPPDKASLFEPVNVLISDSALDFERWRWRSIGVAPTSAPKLLYLHASNAPMDPMARRAMGVDDCLPYTCKNEELKQSIVRLSQWQRAESDPSAPDRACTPTPFSARARPRCAGGLAPAALRRVADHIELHLSSKIELQALAAIAGLSNCHFARAFKQSLGDPPRRYILARRISAAAELIRDTDRSIADVSFSVGFSDQSHFTRLFVQRTGSTPRAYRRKHR